METVYIFLDFPVPIICSKEVLGQSFDVIIGGVRGLLELPVLPAWNGNAIDSKRKDLLPPNRAMAWRMGNEVVYWGRPISNPSGVSKVAKMLLSFDYEVESHALDIIISLRKAFRDWVELLNTYIELVSKRSTVRGRINQKQGNRIKIFKVINDFTAKTSGQK